MKAKKRYRLWALWMHMPGWLAYDVVAARTHSEATAMLRKVYPRWMCAAYAGRWKVAPAPRGWKGHRILAPRKAVS